jgi:hypothetical protein
MHATAICTVTAVPRTDSHSPHVTSQRHTVARLLREERRFGLHRPVSYLTTRTTFTGALFHTSAFLTLNTVNCRISVCKPCEQLRWAAQQTIAVESEHLWVHSCAIYMPTDLLNLYCVGLKVQYRQSGQYAVCLTAARQQENA